MLAIYLNDLMSSEMRHRRMEPSHDPEANRSE